MKKRKSTSDEKHGDDERKDIDVEGDNLDIFSVEDVCDVGNGEPLFVHFNFEDWALLQLRYELYLLQAAFKKDVDDPERLGIHETHFAFYYNKYFRKQLNPKYYGFATNMELTELVKDTVYISPQTQVLMSQLADDTNTVDIFVKLTEENRRERQRRIDAGDETAKLKFSPLAMQQPSQQPRATVPATGATAVAGTTPAAGTARPTGTWQQARPGQQQWTQAARGTIYPQAGFRAPMVGRWPGQQAYAPRQPYAQKWR